MSEASKISIRNHRRKVNDDLKTMKNDKAISEDEMFKSQDDVQKITDGYITKIDDMTKVKEAEILEI